MFPLHGIKIATNPLCVVPDLSRRRFPYSRHRSKRILKKLIKRHGGEFHTKPMIYQIGDVFHTTPEVAAELRRAAEAMFAKRLETKLRVGMDALVESAICGEPVPKQPARSALAADFSEIELRVLGAMATNPVLFDRGYPLFDIKRHRSMPFGSGRYV